MNGKRTFKRATAPIALAVMLGLGLSACGSSTKSTTSTTSSGGSPTTSGSSTGSTSAPSGAKTTAIDIKGFNFKPSPAQAKVGDMITVTNADNTDHSLTADDGSFDTGVFSTGSKTITLSKAGKFAYHCKIHNFMTGSIQVGA